MKVCTFNVNSIRIRKDLISNWLEHRNYDIDILCFQETKVVDEKFPYHTFEKLGFKCEVFGQKGFNGVATCSKTSSHLLKKGFDDHYWDQQKRIISIKVRDINILNVYAPHGELRGTEKYHYKLDWYKHLVRFITQNYSPEEKILLVGDLNVAKETIDIYDPEIFSDSIGTMIEEKSAFKELLNWGFIDTFRHLYPKKKQFTWWDYIGGKIWRNEGMRIDYILCTKPLLENIKDVEVDLWPRRRRTPKPSDHAPVIGTFNF